MKKTLISFAGFAAIATFIWCVAGADAQQPGQPAPTAAPQVARQRIALVNIAAVLHKFDKANAEGKILKESAQRYADRIGQLNEQIQKCAQDMNRTPKAEEKEAYQRHGRELVRQKEDLEAQRQKDLGERGDKVVVEVYHNIKSVIEAVAVANNIELVMCYPDVSTAAEEDKPQVAQTKLQTPGLIPFYHRNMDITDVVVKTLNTRYPAPPVAATPVPTGVVPTGGTAPIPPLPPR